MPMHYSPIARTIVRSLKFALPVQSRVPFRSSSSSSTAAAANPTFILKRDAKHTVYAVVTEQHEKGKYVQEAVVREKHTLVVDERGLYGGFDLGPSPYDLVVAALGGCTSMTLRMYADRKTQFVRLPRITVTVLHAKVNAADVECAAGVAGQVDLFEVILSTNDDDADQLTITTEMKARLLEIADKCPVHKTLAGNPRTFVRTKWN